MTTAFERAVAFLLRPDIEGTFVDDPHDPGGVTNFGISQRAYPTLDIRRLTRADAERIYHADFWLKVQGDSWPFPVALALFDTGVHAGPTTAIRLLQQSTGAWTDGVIGTQTRQAAATWDAQILMLEILSRRLLRLTTHQEWTRYALGWSRRCFACARVGLTS